MKWRTLAISFFTQEPYSEYIAIYLLLHVSSLNTDDGHSI